MNRTSCMLTIFIYTLISSCSSQKNIDKNKITTQKGVLMYYINQPYFFPIVDTSFETISRANAVGLKLGKIDFNDILDSVSIKHDITVYAYQDKDKIDTIKEKASLLPVIIQTKPVLTKLSSDTSAFSLVTGNNEWVFRYEFRYDTEIISVKPTLSQDIKAFKQRLKNLPKY